MTIKRYFLYFCYVSFLLLIVGCDNKENANNTNHNLEAKVRELEQIIEKQQAVLDEHEEKLTNIGQLDMDVQLLKESNSYIDNKLYMLETLIEHTTSYKTAMLNDATIQENTINLNVTYTNFVDDEEGPNGFRLEETEEGTKILSLSKDVPVYKLIDPGTFVQATLDEIREFRGFVQLFEKDGKIVFISEIYLP